jgi:hypothetical protein
MYDGRARVAAYWDDLTVCCRDFRGNRRVLFLSRAVSADRRVRVRRRLSWPFCPHVPQVNCIRPFGREATSIILIRIIVLRIFTTVDHQRRKPNSSVNIRWLLYNVIIVIRDAFVVWARQSRKSLYRSSLRTDRDGFRSDEINNKYNS